MHAAWVPVNGLAETSWTFQDRICMYQRCYDSHPHKSYTCVAYSSSPLASTCTECRVQSVVEISPTYHLMGAMSFLPQSLQYVTARSSVNWSVAGAITTPASKLPTCPHNNSSTASLLLTHPHHIIPHPSLLSSVSQRPLVSLPWSPPPHTHSSGASSHPSLPLPPSSTRPSRFTASRAV